MFEALEHTALPFLPKSGDELQLRNASRVSGVLLLAPSSCQLLSGSAQAQPTEDVLAQPTKDSVALTWFRGDVDDSDPPPRFTQVSESTQAETLLSTRSRYTQFAQKPEQTPTPQLLVPTASQANNGSGHGGGSGTGTGTGGSGSGGRGSGGGGGRGGRGGGV